MIKEDGRYECILIEALIKIRKSKSMDAKVLEQLRNGRYMLQVAIRMANFYAFLYKANSNVRNFDKHHTTNRGT